MKVGVVLLLSFCLPLFLQAQDFYKKDYLVLKGQVKNAKTNFIEFGITSFFGSSGNSIKLEEDGSFNQRIAIQNQQSIFLGVDSEMVYLMVINKDTLEMSWDANKFSKTFLVKGTSDVRTRELQVEATTTAERTKSLRNMYGQLYQGSNTLSPEKKYTLINDTYNENVKKVFDLSGGLITQNLNYFITNLYFNYTDLLRDLELLPIYKLRPTLDPSNYPAISEVMDWSDKYRNYSQLNYDWFVNVPEFRNFIYNYVRFYDKNRMPFMSWSTPSTFTPKLEKRSVASSNSFTLSNYNAAQKYFSYTDVKDWFITKTILDDFKTSEFADVEKVYTMFATSCQNRYLKDTLQKYYNAIKRLAPGNPAPGFTLKNDNSQTVSLSDFKGKVVYLDFWGTGCGPCIDEFKNHVPDLHKRFEGKNIVFINICVDSGEREWMEAIKKYNIKGVNLIASGWERNPVVKSYNVSGLPHYILIDKTGAIASSVADRPSLMANDNVIKKVTIDFLLK